MNLNRTTALMLVMTTSLLATPAALAQPLIDIDKVKQTAGADERDTNTRVFEIFEVLEDDVCEWWPIGPTVNCPIDAFLVPQD